MAAAVPKLGDILADYHQVSFGKGVRLSAGCSLCGRVSVGDDVTVFAGAQVRGDCAPVRIGAGTNIQENCCLHVSGGAPLSVGCNVTVGHGAILHGCTIEDNVLVGMGSIVMDGAHVGRDCLIAAGAVITEGREFPPRSLIMGMPAKAVRELTDEQIDQQITRAGADYRAVGKAMMADGLLLEPAAGAAAWPLP